MVKNLTNFIFLDIIMLLKTKFYIINLQKMETPKTSAEKRKFTYLDWKLIKHKELALALNPFMNEFETHEFNRVKWDLLNLVKHMDKIKEKLEKLYSLWIDVEELKIKFFSFGTIHDEWFRWTERDNITYYDLENKLQSLDNEIDKILEEYNKINEQ